MLCAPLIGPKELGRRLEVDIRTAKAILAGIADFEVADGIWRLTEEGYQKWYTAKRAEGLESKVNGKVQGGQGSVGSKKKAPRWQAHIEVCEDGSRSREVGGTGGQLSA